MVLCSMARSDGVPTLRRCVCPYWIWVMLLTNSTPGQQDPRCKPCTYIDNQWMSSTPLMAMSVMRAPSMQGGGLESECLLTAVTTVRCR